MSRSPRWNVAALAFIATMSAIAIFLVPVDWHFFMGTINGVGGYALLDIGDREAGR